MQIQLEEKGDGRKAVQSAKRVGLIAVFVALSAVGAMIKIPGPLASVALDSAPGFFSALAFGSWEGMAVIALGHLLTAGLAGFYLTVPVHLAIAGEMAVAAFAVRWTQRKLGLIPAVIVGVLLNGVAAPFILWPMGGMAAVLGAMPVLVIGSGVNLVAAAVVYQALKGTPLIK